MVIDRKRVAITLRFRPEELGELVGLVKAQGWRFPSVAGMFRMVIEDWMTMQYEKGLEAVPANLEEEIANSSHEDAMAKLTSQTTIPRSKSESNDKYFLDSLPDDLREEVLKAREQEKSGMTLAKDEDHET